MNGLNFSITAHPSNSCNALSDHTADNLNEQRVILVNKDVFIEDKNEPDMTAKQSYPVHVELVQEPIVVIEVKDEQDVEVKDEPEITSTSNVNFEAPIANYPSNFEPVPEPGVVMEVKVEPDIEIKDEPDMTGTLGANFEAYNCPVRFNLVPEPDTVFECNEKPGFSSSIDANFAAQSLPEQLDLVQEPDVVIEVKDEPGVMIEDEPDVICLSDADFEAPSYSDPVEAEPVQELHIIIEVKDTPYITSSSDDANSAAQSYPVQAEPVQIPVSACQTREESTGTLIIKRMGPQPSIAGNKEIILGNGDLEQLGPIESRQSNMMRKKERMEETGSCSYKCGICNEEFSSEMQLQIHVRFHKFIENEMIVCSFCDKVFTGKTGAFSHLRCVHGIVLDYAKSTKTELLVPVFQTNSENITTLNVHRVKKLDCETCGTKFSSVVKFTQGETVSSETSEVGTRTKNLCGRCQKDSAERFNTRIRDGKKQYECSECRRWFFWPLYEDHIRSLHGRLKLFKCNVCGKKCVSRPSLRVHKKSHIRNGKLN